MRVIAVLCWYDESPTWLATTTASLAKCADHLVAVDGAYRLYPEGRGRSQNEQADAIVRAAEAVGIGLTLYQQDEPFAGNEVEKRSLSLRLAEAIATPYEDWYLVIDGDETVLEVAEGVRARLASTDKDVATCGLTEWMPDPFSDEARTQFTQTVYIEPTWTVPVRRLYRALPGLRYEDAHFVITAEVNDRKRYVSGLTPHHYLEPAEELHQDIRIEHRHRQRTLARLRAAQSYYHVRDSSDAERLSTVLMESPSGELVEVT